MTTAHEQAAKAAADEWLNTLDPKIRANTQMSEMVSKGGRDEWKRALDEN